MPVVSPRVAAAYFGVQSASVAAWWALLALRPSLRALFHAPDAPYASLLAFAPCDGFVLALGSAAVAVGRRGARSALAWVVAGATVYAAIYTVTLAASGDAGPAGAVLMVPAAAASLLCAHALQRGSR